MKLSAWRIVQERHAAGAFSGEGAQLYGGRWNSPGVALLYTAESRALAALEMLVHLDSPKLLDSYVLFEVVVEDSWVTKLALKGLPEDWRDDPVPAGTQAIGDAWVANAASPVLRVPSILIPEESNFLLNPMHPEFLRLRIGDPKRFAFDWRLKSR